MQVNKEPSEGLSDFSRSVLSAAAVVRQRRRSTWREAEQKDPQASEEKPDEVSYRNIMEDVDRNDVRLKRKEKHGGMDSDS